MHCIDSTPAVLLVSAAVGGAGVIRVVRRGWCRRAVVLSGERLVHVLMVICGT